MVLGSTAERSFRQAMMMSDGNWSIFLERRVSQILILAILVMLVLPFLRAMRRKSSVEAP